MQHLERERRLQAEEMKEGSSSGKEKERLVGFFQIYCCSYLQNICIAHF